MQEITRPGTNNNNIIESYNLIITNTIIRNVTGCDSDSLSVLSLDKIDNAIYFMHKNLNRKISVDEMAASVNLSTTYFTKLFKQTTLQTPVRYLSEIRIEKAKRLLKTSKMNFSEIAYECGFTSPSYFTRSFVVSEKITPGEYRKKFVH